MDNVSKMWESFGRNRFILYHIFLFDNGLCYIVITIWLHNKKTIQHLILINIKGKVSNRITLKIATRRIKGRKGWRMRRKHFNTLIMLLVQNFIGILNMWLDRRWWFLKQFLANISYHIL